MVFPGEAHSAVEIMTATASAAAPSSSRHSPQQHRSMPLCVKPRSRLSQPPFRTWDDKRLGRCAGDIDGGSVSSTSLVSPSNPRRGTTGPRDDSFERIRAKLMDHLREAAGRMEVPLATSGDARRKELITNALLGGCGGRAGVRENGDNYSDGAAAATAASAPSATAGALRTRRTSVASNAPRSHRDQAIVSRLTPPRHRTCASERREAASRRRRPRFSVSLTKEQIDEDLYAFTGHRAPRRPKKRPRALQKQLEMVFPGMWFSELAAETYQVADAPPAPTS